MDEHNIKKVENLSEYILDNVSKNNTMPKEVAKFARIKARQGKEGEIVITKMKNGLEETKNSVKLDEKTGNPGWIVTNPDGEEYIVEDSNFQKKYEIDPQNPEQFKPKGGPVISVEINEDIQFTAPWGEDMVIKSGGSLIVNGKEDIYGIQKEEFENTYAPTEKTASKCIEELYELLEVPISELDEDKLSKLQEAKEKVEALDKQLTEAEEYSKSLDDIIMEKEAMIELKDKDDKNIDVKKEKKDVEEI